jgi:ATP-dependent helicase/nuclease subunit B
MWRRDPYAIYARHILRLRPLDDLDVDPSRADLGNAVHDALAEFVTRHPHGIPADAERELLRIAENSFAEWLSRPSVWAFWWPRFERVARWFVAEEAARRGEIALSVSEQKGSRIIAAPAGPFTVTAIADRIDRLNDGGLVIIDYKTGQLPQKREIDNGLALQLPLEGAIARDGGFPAITGEPQALEYWRLSGGEPAGQRKAVDDGDPAALIDRTLAEVTALVARFDDQKEPYLVVPVVQWRPRYSDYEHLERLGAIREDEIEAAGGEP